MGFALSADRVAALLALTQELTHARQPGEMRAAIGRHVLDLFDADYFASYEWNAATRRFEAGVHLNMDPANLARYEAHFQYHDPITFKLQARRRATAVVEVMPQPDLVRTEFFNDFLHRDGLWWGMNFYAYDGDRNIGDLRIWRSKQRENYGAGDLKLLNEVGKAFATALKTAHRSVETEGRRAFDAAGICDRFSLTAREAEVAALAASGYRDAEIAAELGIAPTTVRTHLTRAIDKAGARTRSGLAAALLC